ncbi:MAG TPA: hypothetical protein VGM23_08230, partial [Armatimonadota bacterium]
MRYVLTVLFVLLFAGLVSAQTPPNRYTLRGYHQFTRQSSAQQEAGATVQVHAFTFAEAERATVFLSKLYSDFELTTGNRIVTLQTARGPVEAISEAGQGWIVPLLVTGGKQVTVLLTDNQQAALAVANRLLTAAPIRRTQISHPLYMDKWDRYAIGVWGRTTDIPADPLYKDPTSYYGWMGKVGLNAQTVSATNAYDLTTNDNMLRWARQYWQQAGVKFQVVEWLNNSFDLYNRNPYLSVFSGSGLTSWAQYYGEAPHAPGVLREVQNASALANIAAYDQDPNLMAILDPNGEIGPFAGFFYSEYGPVQTRNFVRYLREVHKFTLDDVSKRYYGKSGVLKSWDDVTQADWREFFGWTSGSVDLQGEWRVMRDDDMAGLRNGWQMPTYDDSDWIRLTYPGDATLSTLPADNKPLWLRRTVRVQPGQFKGTVYLTVAPLTQSTGQVFVNGHRAGAVDPRNRNAHAFGQYDVTNEVQTGSLTVALRLSGREAPYGPVFLTTKKLQDFPTDDPKVNARRADQFDFIDWAVADSVRTTLREIRSIDPDRPIKVHAYAGSPWGWRVVSEMGGFSHHTGSGAGWSYTDPKSYGLSRHIQDSSETGGSMSTVRDTKGLFGNLIFMGKNAHDYFHDLQSITQLPGMRDWLAAKLPDIRLMGRENAHESTIASIRGLENSCYIGDFMSDAYWRNGYGFSRGGEMTPLLDELRVEEGNLPYRAIFDEGTICWSPQMGKALETYVTNGGLLFLAAGSGRNTFEERNKGYGPVLAGVQITGEMAGRPALKLTTGDPLFGTLTGDLGPAYPHQFSPNVTLTPLPGTTVIGTYTDGTPAITKRTLGKGAVFFCAAGVWPG